jgi:DNA invertase Pin-like site-specific DNA recombinase
MEGIERAKGEKKYKGRKSKITPKLISEIEERLYHRNYNHRNYKRTEIPRSLGISKATYYRALQIKREMEKKEIES